MSQLTICLIIFFVTLALYASNIFPMSVVAILSLLAYVFSGCIDGATALSGFANTNTIVLLGMFIVAAGFNRTSFVDKLSQKIVKIAGGSFKRAWLCYILLAAILTNVIPFILTQFMLNQGVSNIFTPICLLTCASLGANPIGPMILVQAGSLTAFLTPMATPAIPMAMGAGGYDLKSLVKQGWLISIVLAVGYVFYVMTVFPCF